MSNSATEKPSKTIGNRKDTRYEERRSVRVIAKNVKNEMIIMYAKRDNYYKLPGGGIEAKEDHCIAARRESLEETGCEVKIEGDYIAVVEEWRNDLHQLSYCYVATLVDDTGAPELTEEEMSDGLQHEWVSVATALERMKAVQPTSELARFIKERDIFFVETFARR